MGESKAHPPIYQSAKTCVCHVTVSNKDRTISLISKNTTRTSRMEHELIILARSCGMDQSAFLSISNAREAISSNPKLYEDALRTSIRTRIIAPLAIRDTSSKGIYFPFFGMSLRDDVRAREDKVLPLTSALSICRDVATGLGHAHANRVLHLDVKVFRLT